MEDKDRAPYDSIGDSYEEYAAAATMKRAESHSVLQMVGDLQGKSVLDLACGTGFYTRLFLTLGAESALGVDLSEEMVRVATEAEAKRPLGATYRVGKAQQIERLGRFDVVTAIWLLNYAESREQLRDMARAACANLRDDGRFVAFTINPSFDYRTSESAKYGVRVVGEDKEGDHVVCHGEFVLDPPLAVDVRRFSAEIYEAELRAAGFSRIEWRPATVAAGDLQEYGEPYWRDFLDNCIGIGIVAGKSAETRVA